MKRRAIVMAAALVILPNVCFASQSKEPWYAKTVSAFSEAAYIDERGFSAATKATRAEFVELVLRLLGGKIHLPFGEPVFDDIGIGSPFFATFQESARGKWVRGVGDCVGSRPCVAAPFSPVNRAEAASLIIRAFGVAAGAEAPAFADNPPDLWYYDVIRAASSRCILQGDDGPGNSRGGDRHVRPGDSMNRAEMLAMLHRAMQILDYPECTPKTAIPLPRAQKEFSIVQIPAASVAPSSFSSASSVAIATASSASFSISSNTYLSPSATLQVQSSSSYNTATQASPPQSSARSATIESAASFVQDPRYGELLGRFQQYITEYSNMITRARSAEGETAVRLLIVLRSQIDLLNQLYPYVELARSRLLSASDASVIMSLQNRIETDFAQAQR
ncbi:hypothetical protein HYW84_02720 [Candidatus Peregrinibacteria bacterium]|nr:hypothetical protein [Candidatus Peregrinibacteria bacterium]